MILKVDDFRPVFKKKKGGMKSCRGSPADWAYLLLSVANVICCMEPGPDSFICASFLMLGSNRSLFFISNLIKMFLQTVDPIV